MGLFGGKPIIEKLEKKKDVTGLIKAPKHKNKDIQKETAQAVGDIGDTKWSHNNFLNSCRVNPTWRRIALKVPCFF